ncbi:MAG: hypothetical protein P8M71_03115 [Pseudomonadales bacterium]|nr:hypothetical protein [Pseudomonadales bacterium]
MPRKKRVDPDPLESFSLEDGTIFEIRDGSCTIKSRGWKNRDQYEENRDHVLEKVLPIYVTQTGRKKPNSRDDILKSGAAFERWYTLQGFPERNETDIRKRLFKDIKEMIGTYANAVENKIKGTSPPQF